MRFRTVVFLLGSAFLLAANSASSQPLSGPLVKPPLMGRTEVDEHEHSFTVRFYIKNVTDKDIEVTYGRGDKGLEVVLFFSFGRDQDICISPPT